MKRETFLTTYLFMEKHLFTKPIDHEELPFPKLYAPELIKNLVNDLPACWQQTAALALLPALSVACGGMTYGKTEKPLAFQVAVFGMAGTGKTQFSCRPAQVVQHLISRHDDACRDTESSKANGCPRVMGFDISTVMLSKYLQHAKSQTVMLYTDEISSATGNDKSGNSFMQLQPILRKGFDGIEHTMDYKEKDSFRGRIYPRMSFLACGTPHTVFRYFNGNAVEDGSTRRVIFVEHPYHEEHVEEIAYSKEQLQYFQSEIEWLELQQSNLHLDAVEKAVLEWKQYKRAECGDDMVAKLMINTPTDIYRRTAYLAYVLNHYQDLGKAITFGRWVAEYALRCAFNITYNTQKNIEEKDKAFFSQSAQLQHEDFNEQMLAQLPETFSRQDVYQYRDKQKYSGDKGNMAIISRWKKRGKITQIDTNKYKKL